MTHYLVSTDKDNYGTIKFRSSINTANCMVAYRINALSTISSFSMTTPDDYLIIETTPPETIPVEKEEEEEEFVEEEEEQTNETTNNEQTNETTNNEQTNEEEQMPELIELTLHFQEHGTYEMRTLAYELNNLFEGQLVPVNEELPIEFVITMDPTNRLIITANKDFTIKEASHRAKLLLGLYDYNFQFLLQTIE